MRRGRSQRFAAALIWALTPRMVDSIPDWVRMYSSEAGSTSVVGSRLTGRQIGNEHQLVTVRVGMSTAPSVLKRWPDGEPFRLPMAWSPDGRWILIRHAGYRVLLASDGSSGLFATAVDSGVERIVTTVDFPRTAENVSGLSLSPDGKRLYTSYADAPFDI